MDMQTCCFTGHRVIDPQEIPYLHGRLQDEIIYLTCQGVYNFLAGGSLGFDTIAETAVLELKEELPEIRLRLILPYRNQTKRWGEADKEKYNLLLSQADEVVYTSEPYFNGCIQKRDDYLVDHSQICICYLRETTGGAAYTVRRAEEKGLTVVNIAPI